MRVFYDVKHGVIACKFYDIQEYADLYYSKCCDKNHFMLLGWN